MTANYGFSNGADEYARARDLGTFNSKPLKMPMVEVATAVPGVSGYGWAQPTTTTAISLPNIPVGASHALVTVEAGGGDIRYRQDATAPITTPTGNANAGLRVAAGGAVYFAGNLSSVRLIGVTSTATIQVEYQRYDQ